MAVYHVEETRYVAWPSFAETSVRDFDTLVVVACDDPDLDDGKPIEAHWLLVDGMQRRRFHEAEARLRRFEHGASSRRAKPKRAATM